MMRKYLMKESETRINELMAAINKHRELYSQGKPEISPGRFDALVAELKKLDPKNPIVLKLGKGS